MSNLKIFDIDYFEHVLNNNNNLLKSYYFNFIYLQIILSINRISIKILLYQLLNKKLKN